MARRENPSRIASGYRLVAPRWESTAFSGEGARKYGGRWNSPGTPMIYLAESRALAALELLVHLGTPGSRAKPFSFFAVELPEPLIDRLEASALPSDWRRQPPGRTSMALGDAWQRSGSSLALRVPSVTIPEETNLLLNPQHPEMPRLKISRPAPFRFDPRL